VWYWSTLRDLDENAQVSFDDYRMPIFGLTLPLSNMADLLGDPNFPMKAMSVTRAEKIVFFQALYKQYSRLNFTQEQDRPFAISGLEKRLQKAFHTKGGYGIFDNGDQHDDGLFHRSLLWAKGEEATDDKFLTRIAYPHDVRIPTWSWMAYKGGIDYIDPPFQSAYWELNEVIPPWTDGSLRYAISAVVRDFTVAGRLPHEVKLTYDTGKTTIGSSGGQRTQCVIVAKGREGRSNRERRHYVLLVTPTKWTIARGEKFYERVGAGFMLGKFISLDREGIPAKII
jgi:hypothetical protein